MENRSKNKQKKSKKIGDQSRVVYLNVGGSPFQTTVGTVSSCDNRLRHMVAGGQANVDPTDGRVFIDRSAKHFHTVLNYLRDGSVSLPHNTTDLQELRAEAKFYLIEGLIHLCQEALHQKYKEDKPLPSVTMVSSADELHQLLATTSKPVISLTINRNLYECKNSADARQYYENVIKNIELFEKLSYKLCSGDAIYVRDFTEQSECGCSWSFYYEGVKHLGLITDDNDYPESNILELLMRHLFDCYRRKNTQGPVIPTSHEDFQEMTSKARSH